MDEMQTTLALIVFGVVQLALIGFVLYKTFYSDQKLGNGEDIASLPAIREDKPEDIKNKFNVRITSTAKMKTSVMVHLGITTLITICFLRWIQHQPQSTQIVAVFAFGLAFFAALTKIWLNWKRYMFFQQNSLVLEVGETGVWFEEHHLFVPYERCRSIILQSIKGHVSRLVTVKALMTKEEAKRIRANTLSRQLRGMSWSGNILTIILTGGSGETMPSQKEILENLHVLAAKKNTAAGLQSPTTNIKEK